MKKLSLVFFLVLIILLISCTSCDSYQIDKNLFGDWTLIETKSSFFNQFDKCLINTDINSNNMTLYCEKGFSDSIVIKINVDSDSTNCQLNDSKHILYITEENNYYLLNFENNKKVKAVYKRKKVENEK